MADTKISALPAVSAALLADEVPVNEGGTTKKMSLTQLAALFGNTLYNASVADQTINAGVTALLTGTTVAIPVGKLRIGTRFRFVLALSKTAAGTASNIFTFQLGTNGTTADADILTFTLPATATGVVDNALINIEVTIRGPLTASCIAQGHLRMTHNLLSTGFAGTPNVDLDVTSGAFDATVANLIASIACTTGALTVLTFTQAVCEAMAL